MNSNALLFVILVCYISTVVGVLVKFWLKGVKGKYLFMAPVTPLLITVAITGGVIDTLKSDKSSPQRRFYNAAYSLKLSFDVFPALVGIIGFYLAERALGHKISFVADKNMPSCARLTHKKEKKREPIIEIVPSLRYFVYDNTYQKLAHR